MERCGYCPDPPVAWVTWPAIGRPKGAPMCARHLAERDVPDNFGQRPTVEMLADRLHVRPVTIAPHVREAVAREVMARRPAYLYHEPTARCPVTSRHDRAECPECPEWIASGNDVWQVRIAGRHVATVQLQEWSQVGPFREMLVSVAGIPDVELTSAAWERGTLMRPPADITAPYRRDTRTPADLGMTPSPSRAERDTWRKS